MGVKFPLIFMANPFEALEAAIALQSDEILELAFDKQKVRDEVKRLQTLVQMEDQGLNARGEKMGKYVHATILKKQREGKIYDQVTGFDTGDMYNSTFISVDADGINIFIESKKIGDDFDAKYGPIAGLIPKNCYSLAEFAKEYVHEKARNILGLR